MIKTLDKEFIGTGEVGGYKFVQINSNDKGYLYKVTSTEGNVHYEVFLRKITPICIDFENRVYSETDFKEIYPSSKQFGLWASCTTSYDRANKILGEL